MMSHYTICKLYLFDNNTVKLFLLTLRILTLLISIKVPRINSWLEKYGSSYSNEKFA